MNTSLIAATVWVIGGNIWHAVLLLQRKGPNRPSTISEHAVEKSSLLFLHRVIHSLPILLFLSLVINLLHQDYHLAAALLMIAALSDSIQAITLNKHTAPLQGPLNMHRAAAWVMAVSYFCYTILINTIAGVPVIIYGSLLTICIILLYFAVTNRFRQHFLSMQMAYFVILSFTGVIAHYILIVQ